jgi:hypothetical protein
MAPLCFNITICFVQPSETYVCQRCRLASDIRGILTVIGFHILPTLRLYWSVHDLYITQVVKVMSLCRFTLILGHLHFNDNSQIPTNGQPG